MMPEQPDDPASTHRPGDGGGGGEPAPDAAEIHALIEQFAHMPLNVRIETTKKIVNIGMAAVPALIAGLAHSVWSVRQDCANALAELPDESAVPALTGALKDPEPGVVYEAARALGRIATEEAKRVLKEAVAGTEDRTLRHHFYDCIDGHI